MTPAATFKWGDQFWDTEYNKAAQNFAAAGIKPGKKLVVSDSSESSSEMSEFEIEKSSVRLRLKAKIAEKSKEISKKSKKEKNEKKDKKDKKEKKKRANESD